MVDLSTSYLGLKLNGPIVVSSTPLSESIDSVRRMEDAGASAVVLASLFEEQLDLESRTQHEDLSRATDSSAESQGDLPELKDYRVNHETYLDYLRRVKSAVNLPIMGSLNGATPGGWVRFAQEMEQAGADGIELNTYALPTSASQTSQSIEQQLIELVESVCKAVKVPVAVKLSHSFTGLPHLATQLEEKGARAVVLFNRFYQPDFDIETLEVRPTLHFSTPSELLPRLHWAAILFGQLKGDLAITGGVHSAEDVLKGIMAGANVTMMASALHIHGIDHIGRVLADVRYWMDKREYGSLTELRGCLSRRSVPDSSPFDRGNYIKTLSSYSLRQTMAAF